VGCQQLSVMSVKLRENNIYYVYCTKTTFLHLRTTLLLHFLAITHHSYARLYILHQWKDT
jgi:hypothetical protein